MWEIYYLDVYVFFLNEHHSSLQVVRPRRLLGIREGEMFSDDRNILDLILIWMTYVWMIVEPQA